MRHNGILWQKDTGLPAINKPGQGTDYVFCGSVMFQTGSLNKLKVNALI
jgi:hypothetical protein